MKTKKTFDFLVKILLVLSIFLVLFLAVTSFIYRFPTNSTDTHMHSSPFILFAPVLVCVFSMLLGKILRKVREKIKYFDWIIVGVLTIAWSIFALVFVSLSSEKPI